MTPVSDSIPRERFLSSVKSGPRSVLDSDIADDPHLVAGRTCGSCNVCCVELTIDDPELQKVQGYRCPHAQRDNSCRIYATRPHTCRAFFCGWRRLKWIRESLRPDKSGVLVRLHGEVSQTDGTQRLGVEFTLLNAAALKAEGLAESVAAAVAADVPVFLNIPGPPGFTSAQAKINDVLRDAVLARDKAAVLRILREAHAKGRSGERRRIVLSRPRTTTRNNP
jgi:Fe-S-cluster containining protein